MEYRSYQWKLKALIHSIASTPTQHQQPVSRYNCCFSAVTATNADRSKHHSEPKRNNEAKSDSIMAAALMIRWLQRSEELGEEKIDALALDFQQWISDKGMLLKCGLGLYWGQGKRGCLPLGQSFACAGRSRLTLEVMLLACRRGLNFELPNKQI